MNVSIFHSLRFYFIIIGSLVFSIQSSAQEELTSTIKGLVLDKDSRQTLPGAHVVLLNSQPLKGVATDVNGEFRLENVPVGRQGITVSFFGYRPVTIDKLLLFSAKELYVEVELEEDFIQLEAVEVKAEKRVGEAVNEMNTVSNTVISTEEAARYAGTMLDVSRMSQRYAGVGASDDTRNDVIIRGNSPLGVLWRLEGIDIPSPNHFATLGTTGGPISMLNVNNLRNSDFLTGAWNAEYGNALSGVFDLRLKEGNKDKAEQMFQTGFNGLEAGAEGPLKKGKRSSYMLNYRYSLLGILSAIGVDFGTGSAIPEYQDITFKLNFPTKKAGTFALWGLGGLSDISFQPEEEENLYNTNYEDSKFVSNTAITGLSWNYFLDNKTLLSLNTAFSAVETNGKIDSVDINGEPQVRLFEYVQNQYRYSAHAKINRKISSKDRVNFGVIYDLFQFDVFDQFRDEGVYIIGSQFDGAAPLIQSYAQWKHRFSDKTSMISGVHQQTFGQNGSTAIEPRISAEHKLTGRSTLSLGLGMHSQMQSIVSYYAVDDDNSGSTPNQDLDFSKALHSVLGYQFFFNDETRMKTELYVQRLYDIPIDTLSSSFSMINEGADFGISDATGLENEGTGLNYGLEITLERSLSHGLYFLVTTSLFESKYIAGDGVKRNTAFNSNYIVNVLGGKEWTLNEKTTLSLDARCVVAGGKPYIPINLDLSRQMEREIRDENRAFSESYPAYFRTDIRLGFRRNGPKVSQEFAFDMQNATNNKNVFWTSYDSASQEINTTYQLGLLPIVLYRLYF